MTEVDKTHHRYAQRQKGVHARVVDSKRLTDHILKIMRLTYPHFDGIERCEVEPLVFAEIKDKDCWGKPRVAIIGTEGVGWMSDADSRIVPIPVWSSNGLGYARPVELHRDVLMEFVTDEEIDLADWVRIFGDRLETNLGIWQNTVLTEEVAEV